MKIKCMMMKEGSRRGWVGTEKQSGKWKEMEEDDEVVVVGMKRRRTELESEWRREVELKLFGMDARMREGFQEMMRRLEEIRELLLERDAELEREDGEKDGDGEKDEEMAVENEVTGAEVREDGEVEKGADVEME